MSFQVQGLLLFREGFAETHFLELESRLAQAVRGEDAQGLRWQDPSRR